MAVTETRLSEVEVELQVKSAETVAEDVLALRLEPGDGSGLPDWTPGAHVDLVLADGTVRQYSLCGSPADTNSWRVAVLKAPDSRGGSKAVHALSVGDTVTARGPRNHFPLVTHPRYIFIAGGIGITPILPMIEEVVASGADWELHYGGRQRASMAYADDLAVHADHVHLVPEDEAGLLDLDAILGTAQDAVVYCCGPEPLLAAVEERCEAWPTGSLHLERFSAKETDTDNDSAFDVVLQRSGQTLNVPADKSIFEVVRGAGISVLGSCLEGVCGTCETEVLDGEIEHRDSVLSVEEQEEDECMMICVSRARSASITLDL